MKTRRNRIALIIATTSVFALSCIQGLSAQVTNGMFADADGIEPPDVGIAYQMPIKSVATSRPYPLWPELVALMAVQDGMNAPNIGFAYELPSLADRLAAQQSADTSRNGLLLDADGLEPPDLGRACEIEPKVRVIAECEAMTRRCHVVGTPLAIDAFSHKQSVIFDRIGP